jgi:hypothetical protein
MSFAASTQPQVAPLTGRDIELASLGTYYVASTATPGTGQISNNPTTLVATTPSLVVYNGGNTADVHLHFLRLTSTVASTGAALRNYTHFVDQGNRFSSGGAALTVKNTNPTSTNASNVVANFGAITATAASSAQRQIGNDSFRGVFIDIIGDVYEYQYGAPGGGGSVSSVVTTVAHFVHTLPPIVLPPNTSYVMNIWSSTFSTGITFEIMLGFSER